jgi:hypothetical protein
MNLKVKFMRQLTSPLQTFSATREFGSASVRLMDMLDAHMQHYDGVRVYNPESVNALIKACRAGIFGRGSLLRYHMVVSNSRGLHVFPLFKRADATSGATPNYMDIEKFIPGKY